MSGDRQRHGVVPAMTGVSITGEGPSGVLPPGAPEETDTDAINVARRVLAEVDETQEMEVEDYVTPPD